MVNLFSNRRGDAMIIAMVSVVVSSVVVLGLFGTYNSWKKNQLKQVKVDQVGSLIKSVVWSIENDVAWNASTAASGPMACLRANGAVCAAGTNFFDVRFADNTVLAFGNPGDGNGLTEFGNGCVGFATGVPNNGCPLAFEITWSPDCVGPCPATVLSAATGAVVVPKINISVKLIYSGTNPNYLKINFNRFTENFVRGSFAGTLAANCAYVNGTFNPETQKCTLPVVATTCAVGTSLKGIAPDGTAICRRNPWSERGCGSGFAPVNILPGGYLQCSKF